MNSLVTDSILNSVKAQLGIMEEYRPFDDQILLCINSAMSILEQIGMPPEGGFIVYGPEQTWDDLIPGRSDMEFVKTYIFLKTKMLFDPPTSSIVANAIDSQLKELEFRISANVDRIPEQKESVST